MLTNANLNMTRLWCKIVPKTNVEQIEGNEGSFFYLYPFGNLTQKNFKDVFMCASSIFFLKTFIIESQL